MSSNHGQKYLESVNLVRVALDKAAEVGTFKLKEAASLLYITEQLDAAFRSTTVLHNSTLKNYIMFLTNSLNKANKKGAFSMEEAYIIKIALVTIESIIIRPESPSPD